MKNSLFKSGVRITLGVLALGAASAALAQTYTFKVGGAYIDPRATSSSLEGTLPVVNSGTYLGNVNAVDGVNLEVQKKSTLIFSIERAFNDNWSVELLLGQPPKHQVKLRSAAPVLTPTVSGGLGLAMVAGTSAKLKGDDGEVVATVRQWAPTAFINYTFLDKSSAFRPFAGVGVNYTHFKAKSTAVGSDLYNDGNVKIELTDSIGLAFHVGANYKIDKNWLLNASWSTAAVKNHITVSTDHSRQTATYRFHPSVFSLMVGYQY